jgi:hypothetical protein
MSRCLVDQELSGRGTAEGFLRMPAASPQALGAGGKELGPSESYLSLACGRCVLQPCGRRHRFEVFGQFEEYLLVTGVVVVIS